MNPLLILNLILDNGYYEGKHVNNHDEIIKWLFAREEFGKSYFIEQLEEFKHVRVWSIDGWNKEKERRSNKPKEDTTELKKSLMADMLIALGQGDLIKVSEIQTKIKAL